MSQPKHSCDQAGACQNRAVPCLDCTRPGVPEWQPDEVTCTPFEQMGYWITVAVVAVASVGVVGGIAGYLVGLYGA